MCVALKEPRDVFVEIQQNRKGKSKGSIELNEAPEGFLNPEELALFREFHMKAVGCFQDSEGDVIHEEVYDSVNAAMNDGADFCRYLIVGRAKPPHEGNPWYPLHEVHAIKEAHRVLSIISQ
ncbi:hypothetical protein [Aliidiomarina celeris]|uniref:hypothetical protein n=1 Tax=Aliidiomarina celeris TaxID=2249428 RepID=UPI000DE8B924|nr:hypothetical protein [Aliidiomarina celeris]